MDTKKYIIQCWSEKLGNWINFDHTNSLSISIAKLYRFNRDYPRFILRVALKTF